MTTANPAPPARASKVWASFILIALVWGSTWLVIKDQVSTVPPSWGVAWRFVVATVGMLVLVWLRGESLRIPRPAHRLALMVGLAQFCLNFQFVYRAGMYLTSGIIAMLFALLMVPNALLARVFLKAPVGGRFFAGSVVAIGGIALLLFHEYRVAPPSVSIGWGVALGMAGVLTASVANVLQASRPARETPVVPFIAWALVYGAAFDVTLAFAFHGPPVLEANLRYWTGALYLGLIGSVVPFPLYSYLIRRLGAGKAAYNGVAVPVVAMLLSTLFEGYRWSGLAIAGSALAVVGLLIALSARRPG